MTSPNGSGTTTCWTYDDAVNILKREVYPYGQDSDPSARISEVVYTYSDSDWGDLLTSYNGVPITYDGIGNPLNDGTWTYTWQHGRQLASMNKLDGSAQWSFTYNADGLRTQRTNGTRDYCYTYLGGQLTHMTVDDHTLYFAYDAAGTPLSLTYDGGTYYYVTNLQGDVVAILDSTGTEVVRYSYDAWGNLITPDAPENTLGFYNPLRYRGYVYDEETGLYYLQSRYYNPEMGRFINADGIFDTCQDATSTNMYAYCGNNPVNRSDTSGLLWKEVGSFFKKAGKAIVAAAVIVVAVISSPPSLIKSKETHYARNDNNTVKIETIDQVPSDWTTSNTDKYPERKKGAAANAHQNTAPSKDKPHTKFSSPDKHEEVIFSFDEVLVEDPIDIGTYNFGTNVVTHWFLDVVPWIWWGNTADDTSTVWDRANGLVWGTNK